MNEPSEESTAAFKQYWPQKYWERDPILAIRRETFLAGWDARNEIAARATAKAAMEGENG